MHQPVSYKRHRYPPQIIVGMGAFDGELETWTTLAKKLSDYNLTYLHLSDQSTIGGEGIPPNVSEMIRSSYQGTLMSAGGQDKQSAEAAIESDILDMVAFGRPFISNPDLVERLADGWPLTPQTVIPITAVATTGTLITLHILEVDACHGTGLTYER